MNLALDSPLVVEKTLYVAEKPTGPTIYMGDNLRLGTKPNISCSISGGRPTVGLRFMLANESGTDLDVSRIQDLNDTRRIQLLTIHRSFHGQTLMCCYEKSVFPKKCDEETIYLKYPPDFVKVNPRTNFTRIESEYDVDFKCTTANYTANCSTTWSLDAGPITNRTLSNEETSHNSQNKTREHVISIKLKRTDNGKLLTCSSRCEEFAGSEVQEVQDSVTVWTPYEPIIRFNSTSYSLNQTEGDTFVQNCSVDSRPEPEITWKNEAGEPLEAADCGRASRCLKFDRLTMNMSGLYTCVATNSLSNNYTNSSFKLSVKAKSIETQSADQTKQPGDSSNVIFIIVAIAITTVILVVSVIIVIVVVRKRKADKPPIERHDGDVIQSNDYGSSPDESVVYASPIPKSERNQEVDISKQMQMTTEPKELVYADLDLPVTSNNSGGAVPVSVIRSEGETEYVDIDFSKKAAKVSPTRRNITEDTPENVYANQ